MGGVDMAEQLCTYDEMDTAVWSAATGSTRTTGL